MLSWTDVNAHRVKLWRVESRVEFIGEQETWKWEGIRNLKLFVDMYMHEYVCV